MSYLRIQHLKYKCVTGEDTHNDDSNMTSYVIFVLLTDLNLQPAGSVIHLGAKYWNRIISSYTLTNLGVFMKSLR